MSQIRFFTFKEPTLGKDRQRKHKIIILGVDKYYGEDVTICLRVIGSGWEETFQLRPEP